MKAKINKVSVGILQGKLLSMTTEGVVLETDSALSIPTEWAQAAGPELVRRARMIGWCDIGSAVRVPAGRLPQKHVILAVGPRWGDSSARGKLANTTWEVLNLAEAAEMESLALPAISTGTNGYPIENCARTMLEQVIDFTFEAPKHLRQIIFCLSTDEQVAVFQQQLEHQIDLMRQAGDGKVRAG